MATVARLLAAAAAFSIVDDPHGARHVIGVRPHADTPHAERVLLGLHQRLRALAGDYGPRSVHLPGDPPVAGPHGSAEAFGARVRFRQSKPLLRLPAGVLSRRPGDVTRSGTAWAVRRLVSADLPAATLAGTARAMAVHPRTLQRELADEGLRFGEILDCVRRERARAYLSATNLPLGVISARLGLAEPAVLCRCARRWWGASPAQLRRSLREAA